MYKCIKNNKILFLIIGTILFELFIYILELNFDNYNLLYIFPIILLIITIYVSIKRKKIDLFYILFLLGVIIRTLYIYKTSVYDRQHDGLKLLDNGHLGYIYTLFKTHHLPTTNDWQFYHPPLWHFLGALWLTINDFFNINISKSIEGIQILSLLFSSFIIILVNNICINLKLNNKYRYLILTYFSFNPKLVLYSGFINNDCLLLFLEFLIINILINWYDKPNYKNTILLAITFGLSVMTKANGIIMCIPCLYIFIKKLLENKKYKINYLKEGFIFCLISFPLALWYQIRNYLKFSSISVAVPSKTLYIGNHNIISRFFSFNINQLFNKSPIHNYNLPSFIVRSSTIGELTIEKSNYLYKLLISLNLIIIIITLIYIIKYLIKDRKNITINTIIITFIISIISLYIFNYKYPYVCSMSFRYIAISLCTTLIIAYELNLKQNKTNKYIETIFYIFITLSVLFSLAI